MSNSNGSSGPQHLSPIDWWAIGQGIGAFLGLLDQRDRNRAARRWRARLRAARKAHLVEHRRKLAEVSTPAEMAAWDAKIARGGEWSYAQNQAYDAMFRRWCQRNPTAYPSQDQQRAAGWLCRCNPNAGHFCSPWAIANTSAWTPPAGQEVDWQAYLASRGVVLQPRRAVELLLWLPFACWCAFVVFIGLMVVTHEKLPPGELTALVWIILGIGVLALWFTHFLRARRDGLEEAFANVLTSSANAGGARQASPHTDAETQDGVTPPAARRRS